MSRKTGWHKQAAKVKQFAPDTPDSTQWSIALQHLHLTEREVPDAITSRTDAGKMLIKWINQNYRRHFVPEYFLGLCKISKEWMP